MSVINVNVIDQSLKITNTPLIASNGVKEDYIKFTFDSAWSGFSKFAVFYHADTPETIYRSLIDVEGKALVPWEVTSKDGKIYFGVCGIKNDIVYTSEMLFYEVVKGAVNAGAESTPITPGIYEQVLTMVESLKSVVGSPLVANTAAGMTDTNRIYVYTGSETGYTNGNWYYWNGSAWTSGGVYNSMAFETDTTLSVSGKAADAKITGDKIEAIPQYRAGINGSHADYDNLISHYTTDGAFFANAGNWSDLPVNSEDFVIQNAQYSNYIVQTATSISSGAVYNRIIHKTDKTVFRGWMLTGCNDTRMKVLALGDSICYGGHNNNNGFVGGLGLPYVNKSIVGIRLSERNNSNDPAVRDVDAGFYRPSISRLFDYMVGEEIMPDISDLPADIRFNAALITSLSEIPLAQGYYPDIIIVDGGVNDYIDNAELGAIPTVPVFDDLGAVKLNRQTIMGGLQYLFYRMTNKFPKAQRFFLIPHKIYNNNLYWVTAANNKGYTQQDLHDAIVTCCKVYNVNVIDVYNDSFINTVFPQYRSSTPYSQDNSLTNTEYIDADGIHPMALGYTEGYIPLVREAIRIGTVKNN